MENLTTRVKQMQRTYKKVRGYDSSIVLAVEVSVHDDYGVTCPNCGYKANTGTTVCPNCGEIIK